MSLLIKNGTVVNPAKGQHEIADILIVNGVITNIGKNLQADNAEVYDATGLIVAPGLIDIHTHLREPGQEAKEEWYTSCCSWRIYTYCYDGQYKSCRR